MLPDVLIGIACQVACYLLSTSIDTSGPGINAPRARTTRAASWERALAALDNQVSLIVGVPGTLPPPPAPVRVCGAHPHSVWQYCLLGHAHLHTPKHKHSPHTRTHTHTQHTHTGTYEG